MAKKRIFKILTIVALTATLLSCLFLPASAFTGTAVRGDTPDLSITKSIAPSYYYTPELANSEMYSLSGAMSPGYGMFTNTITGLYAYQEYVTNSDGTVWLMMSPNDFGVQYTVMTETNTENPSYRGVINNTFVAFGDGESNTDGAVTYTQDYEPAFSSLFSVSHRRKPQATTGYFGNMGLHFDTFSWQRNGVRNPYLYQLDISFPKTYDRYALPLTMKIIAQYYTVNEDGVAVCRDVTVDVEDLLHRLDSVNDQYYYRYRLSLAYIMDEIDSATSGYLYRENSALIRSLDVHLIAPDGRDFNDDWVPSTSVSIVEHGIAYPGVESPYTDVSRWQNTYQLTTSNFNFLGWLGDTMASITSVTLFKVGGLEVTPGGLLLVGVSLAFLKFFVNKFAGG